MWPLSNHLKKNLVLKKSFVSNKRQMSVFPLSERVLLYVWKVVRVVIQCGCRRWCMLAAWQTVENGPRPAVSRAFCVSLFDQASPGPQEHSFNTSSKRTKRPLSALSHLHPASAHWHPGTNSGRARPLSCAGGLWSGHWSGLGGPLNT